KGQAAGRACYMREQAKIVKSAPAAPKEEPAAKNAGPVATTFVAPPHTIADITAILDNEKADAAPPTSGSRADIAEFHLDRGNARALLARNQEALADGLKALELMPNVAFESKVGRIMQFLSLQYMALGDP